jgi:AP-1 complex subunit sigma 1/2
MINYILLVSRQGKVRLQKWFTTMPQKLKAKIVKDVTQLVLARRAKMCNFLEYKGKENKTPPRPLFFGAHLFFFYSFSRQDTKVVYRRYASLFFVCGISAGDNELAALEIIHRYVEVLDRYFGNVSALASAF